MTGLHASEALLGSPSDTVEPMDTSNNTNTESFKRKLPTNSVHELVDTQNSELVSLIDSLICSSIPL